MIYDVNYRVIDGAGSTVSHGTLENFETDIADEDERNRAARVFALDALHLSRNVIARTVPVDSLNFLDATNDEDEQEDEDEDEEPEIGDEVTCHYCHEEFELTGNPEEQVSVGIYWCGCSEEE
jgi:hypothetical protein